MISIQVSWLKHARHSEEHGDVHLYGIVLEPGHLAHACMSSCTSSFLERPTTKDCQSHAANKQRAIGKRKKKDRHHLDQVKPAAG